MPLDLPELTRGSEWPVVVMVMMASSSMLKRRFRASSGCGPRGIAGPSGGGAQ